MKNIRNICRLPFGAKAHATLTVSIFWLSGLLLGRYAADTADAVTVHVAQLSATAKPILILQMVGQFLPLAVTFLLVHFASWKAVYPVIFFDAFCFAYVAFLTVRAFQTAGWLVYRILLFSECVNALILLWIWFNVIIDRRFLSLRRFCLFSGTLFLVTLFDYFVCSGFLITVLT